MNFEVNELLSDNSVFVIIPVSDTITKRDRQR